MTSGLRLTVETVDFRANLGFVGDAAEAATRALIWR